MRKWPVIREGIISAWFAVLDYDRKIPAWKREKATKDRERAKGERFSRDRRREKSRLEKQEENRIRFAKREEARVRSAKATQRIEVLPPVERGIVATQAHYQPMMRGHGLCPACGSRMKKGARASSSGSGCLILIVGLFLTPFLIGIPLILVGLHYMSKRDGFWRCTRCGMETGRNVSFFEFTA